MLDGALEGNRRHEQALRNVRTTEQSSADRDREMLIHCDAFDIRGDLFEKWRVSFPVSLLRTHCSQERVANDKDIGQRGRDEYPVGVLR